MKIIMLVASVLLVGCIGRAPGDYPGRTDGAPIAPATEEAFADKNGTRLRVYAGYRCADGTMTATGGLFDTRTGSRCFLAGGVDSTYCAPSGLLPDPQRDVRCDAVLMP